ncbi:MAG: hypothetical protein PHW84_01885 [Methanosarcina sp.]|nr:hypothetical protein [Methanosarcina sp.]
MNSLDDRMKHSCQVLSTTQDQRLSFTLGTVAFTNGSILTGSVSGASGIIKTVTVESGSWDSGNAAGYLILYNVSGDFGNEIISDKGTIPGSATASGPAVPQTSGMGTPQTTTSTAPYKCLFSNVSTAGGIQNYSSGDYVVAYDIVFLPGNAIIEEGDLILSTERGYNHTYKVTKVNVFDNYDNTVDHIEASLEVVSKKK